MFYGFSGLVGALISVAWLLLAFLILGDAVRGALAGEGRDFGEVAATLAVTFEGALIIYATWRLQLWVGRLARGERKDREPD